jgi:hypothetical protein
MMMAYELARPSRQCAISDWPDILSHRSHKAGTDATPLFLHLLQPDPLCSVKSTYIRFLTGLSHSDSVSVCLDFGHSLLNLLGVFG